MTIYNICIYLVESCANWEADSYLFARLMSGSRHMTEGSIDESMRLALLSPCKTLGLGPTRPEHVGI